MRDAANAMASGDEVSYDPAVDSGLQAQFIGVKLVRLAGAGLAGPFGSVNRRLDVQPVIQKVYEHLEVRLNLIISPRCPTHGQQLCASLHQEAGHSLSGPATWYERVRVPLLEEEVLKTVVHQNPSARNENARAPETIHALAD